MPGGKTYVDNAQNRSIGRVGLSHGAMPVSRSSSSTGGGSSSGSQSYYVDNAQNRSIGRVGLSHGAMPVSRSSSSSGGGGGGSSSGSQSYYVDNAQNRSLGRVGLPHGAMPVSRSSSSDVSTSNTKTSVSSASSSTKSVEGSQTTDPKVYADNALNRSLGRVGLPHGTAVYSRSKAETRYYKDNALNRRLGRVDAEVGTMPVSKSGTNSRKKPQPTHPMGQLFKSLSTQPEADDDEGSPANIPVQENQCELVFDLINRMNQVLTWQKKNHGKPPQTELETFKFLGPIIMFEDIKLLDKIGHGGFGDVYMAELKDSVVAVKKLRVQRVSKRRLRQFEEEVGVLCRLEHRHIVKFLGACIVTPNLAIVLEYMQKSLYEALHVEEIDFSHNVQHKIILQMADGLAYLHDRSVAHCDMKSSNILLDGNEENLVAKISDFGLSMMKNESETSQSTVKVQDVGTPKYSAPEVLSGKELDLQAMCKADVYSMSVVAWEVICQEVPFYDLNIHQLKSRIVEGDVYLKIPDDIKVGGNMLALLKECWCRDPNKRPSSSAFKDRLAKLESIK